MIVVIVPCDSSRKCSFSPDTGTLHCSVPSLGPTNTSLDFSTASLGRASRLHVECAENAGNPEPVLSTVQSNLVGHLPGLRTLQISNCRIKTIEAYAFSGKLRR